MEEQQTPQPAKTEKKTKKKIVVDEAKIKEAKKKVNDLLQGTGLEEPEVFIPPNEYDAEQNNPLINNVGATSWLSDQVAALSSQVEMLEKQNAQLKVDNTKLMGTLSNGGSLANAGDLSTTERAKILELYKYFEGLYNGKNPLKSKFTDAKFSFPSHRTGILDVFLKVFPFLSEYADYQHWG